MKRLITAVLALMLTAPVGNAVAASSAKEMSIKLTMLIFADRYCGVKAQAWELVRLSSALSRSQKEAVATLDTHQAAAKALAAALKDRKELMRVCGQLVRDYPNDLR